MEFVVYILFSESLNKYYVGQTSDLEKRLKTHNCGGKKYTSKGIPWVLVKTYNSASRSDAMQLERTIKRRGIKRYIEEN
ncbi:GIY-YIG nuclease family protein [Flavobacteriaceae bacterium XHP0103]|uniref:GIY-YIG nuclease family protein n=1 Tax=Marixanthotalea marina TaxID=2844359 RepID=UPI00298A082C|nr:GIY-YIG nuclease family protein [Marixanthotalea marina]MBU3822655.1 GIY-YIG nuclease family protein [Marixanthotalea marina]